MPLFFFIHVYSRVGINSLLDLNLTKNGSTNATYVLMGLRITMTILDTIVFLLVGIGLLSLLYEIAYILLSRRRL